MDRVVAPVSKVVLSQEDADAARVERSWVDVDLHGHHPFPSMPGSGGRAYTPLGYDGESLEGHATP